MWDTLCAMGKKRENLWQNIQLCWFSLALRVLLRRFGDLPLLCILFIALASADVDRHEKTTFSQTRTETKLK